MSCPNTDELIAYGLGRGASAQVESHVLTCETCQADLLTLQALSGAKEAEEGMPPELVANIIASLPDPDPEPIWGGTGWLQLLITAFLGSVTALASLVLTGTVGALRPGGTMLLAAAFGGAAVLPTLWAQARRGSPGGGAGGLEAA